MPRLYRNVKDLQHWYVYEGSAGWLSFPAKMNGWADRQAVAAVHGLDLREVPLWLSFNTGLLESARPRRFSRAA